MLQTCSVTVTNGNEYGESRQSFPLWIAGPAQLVAETQMLFCAGCKGFDYQDYSGFAQLSTAPEVQMHPR